MDCCIVTMSGSIWTYPYIEKDNSDVPSFVPFFQASFEAMRCVIPFPTLGIHRPSLFSTQRFSSSGLALRVPVQAMCRCLKQPIFVAAWASEELELITMGSW